MRGSRPKAKVSKDRLPQPKPVVMLEDVERLNLTVAHLEAELAHETAERRKLERLVLLAQIDPTGRVLAMEKSITECGQRVTSAETRHNEWTGRVKTRLGLNNEFTFDSETGVVTEIPSGQ